MRRLLSSSKKGQWFIISTVIASMAFLSISLLFKNYFVVDTASVATNDEDFYFWNIKYGLTETVNIVGYDIPYCVRLENALNDFIGYSKTRMAEMGYYLYAEKIIDCAGGTTDFGILLASDDMLVYENVDPTTIIPSL